MKLVLPEPPGRITRKAKHFEADIVQLRSQGYTLDAIRQALATAGVHVSISTVRRESVRGTSMPPITQATSTKDIAGTSARPGAATVEASGSPINSAAPLEGLRGRELAKAFMRDHITNQLFRAKEKR